MEEIIVLSKYTCREISLSVIVISGIILFLYFLGVCYAVYKEFNYYRGAMKKRIANIIETILAFLMIIGLVFALCQGYTTTYTEYKIYVPDSITLNEFTKQYKIISYDGNIYTVQEIEK